MRSLLVCFFVFLISNSLCAEPQSVIFTTGAEGSEGVLSFVQRSSAVIVRIVVSTGNSQLRAELLRQDLIAIGRPDAANMVVAGTATDRPLDPKYLLFQDGSPKLSQAEVEKLKKLEGQDGPGLNEFVEFLDLIEQHRITHDLEMNFVCIGAAIEMEKALAMAGEALGLAVVKRRVRSIFLSNDSTLPTNPAEAGAADLICRRNLPGRYIRSGVYSGADLDKYMDDFEVKTAPTEKSGRCSEQVGGSPAGRGSDPVFPEK